MDMFELERDMRTPISNAEGQALLDAMQTLVDEKRLMRSDYYRICANLSGTDYEKWERSQNTQKS